MDPYEVSDRAKSIFSVARYNCTWHGNEQPFTSRDDEFLECVKAAAISSSLEQIANSLNGIKNTLDRIAPKE